MNLNKNQNLLKLLKEAQTAYLEFGDALEKFNQAVVKANAVIQKAKDSKNLEAVRKTIK